MWKQFLNICIYVSKHIKFEKNSNHIHIWNDSLSIDIRKMTAISLNFI